tara:strand:+ start:286 stop:507 length:222 start_codon:yes stop_codon:yes gene_type:complete
MINLNIISEILETKKNELKADAKLSDYVWDSMSQIKLISLLSSKYKKKIDIKKLKKIQSIIDLDKLISNSIKK